MFWLIVFILSSVPHGSSTLLNCLSINIICIFFANTFWERCNLITEKTKRRVAHEIWLKSTEPGESYSLSGWIRVLLRYLFCCLADRIALQLNSATFLWAGYYIQSPELRRDCFCKGNKHTVSYSPDSPDSNGTHLNLVAETVLRGLHFCLMGHFWCTQGLLFLLNWKFCKSGSLFLRNSSGALISKNTHTKTKDNITAPSPKIFSFEIQKWS
jgi:hypothetical protein